MYFIKLLVIKLLVIKFPVTKSLVIKLLLIKLLFTILLLLPNCQSPNLYVTKFVCYQIVIYQKFVHLLSIRGVFRTFLKGGGRGRINLRNFQKTRKLWNRTTTLKQVYLMLLFKKPKSVIEINWFVKFKSRLPIPDYSGFHCKPSERNTSLIFLNFSVTFSSGLKSQTSSLN